jgi:serine/threonine protein kinase
VVNEFGPKSANTAFCTFSFPTPKTKEKRSRVVLVSTCAAAAAIVAFVSAFVIVCLLWERRNRGAVHRQFIRRNRSLLRTTVRPNTGAVWFSIQEINAATQNFSEANLIGQGGFGTVYKGTLPDGLRIAVKRIRNCSAEGDADFLNEVKIINEIRHRNLVVLRGCCVASDDMGGQQRFLIYDYMPNGSFTDRIVRAPLSWEQRKNIILGTAKGLAYLHRGVQPAIYHRDIKPTNILLDDELNARVSDFGLARIMSKDGGSYLTTRVAGTHGYLAPEYALYGQLTEKSDVYSFGALLLEIMSGRKALDTSLESSSDYLITDWAWTLLKAGKAMEVVDERIRHSGAERTMVKFITVGILCAHVMVAFRPTMVEALKMLEGDIEIPEIPDRPLPLTHESLSYGNNETTLYFSTSTTLCPISPTEVPG